MLETMGWVSVIPVLLAIIMAFITRNTVASLATACIVGCALAGKGIFGFTDLLKKSLGNEDFIWVVTINMMVAVLAAYFEKSGAIQGFTAIVDSRNLKRKSIQLVTWLLGCFIFFSDSFSPLFVGGVMRNLSDKANEVTLLVAACFAAVEGGGVFGDHCSPVSDTTILSSMGAACDHIDHVKTQLPIALTVASICIVLYAVVGFVVA